MPQPAKKPSQVKTGPHVEALICERVIQESDGVLSAIRIVDAITHSLPNDAPAPQPFVVNLTILVVVHADGATGRYVVKLGSTTPSGVRAQPLIEQSLDLQPGPLGANLIIPFGMTFAEDGTYWFDVWLSSPRSRADRLATRTPLSIVYARPASAS